MSQYGEHGGGGYLQGSQYGSPGGTPGPDIEKRNDLAVSLRPLMISQLIKATQPHTDAMWSIEGAEVGQISIVGQVVEFQRQTTNWVYTIDDGTGRIDARHWVASQNDAERQKWEGIEENIYVLVSGTLKTYGTKRFISIGRMRPVKDAHEVYFHILETVTVCLAIEKGPATITGQSGAQGAAGTSAYATAGHALNDPYAHLPLLQRNIVKFILGQPRKDEGVHVMAIARAVSTDGDANKLNDALDQLMERGIVYNTLDESHFTVTE